MRGRKWIAAAAAVWIGSMVSVNSYGAVITYTSNNSTFSSKDEDQDEDHGPGVQYLEEEASEFAGPGVNKVTMSERYHEEYQIYEESIANLFFIYANVENGGMTDQAVWIDIPANVLYMMEKDGVQIEYESGRKIGERGTYVLRMTALENPELPLSEQTEYQAVFRFRIQEKPPASKQESTYAVQSERPAETVSSVNLEELREQAAETAEAEETEEAAAEAAVLETAAEEESAEEEIAEKEIALDETEISRSQVYDPMSKTYLTTLENGIQLTSNIPEGYIGPEAVKLTIAEGAPEMVEFYQNDELIEFVNGDRVSEMGSYRLVLDGSAYSFAIAEQVNTMIYYPAPFNMKFKTVWFDDKAQELQSEQWAEMKSDGTYTFVMEGTAGEEQTVVLIKDSEAPEVLVTASGGNAVIEYQSDDIEKILLEKNGMEVEGFRGTSISSPGKYRLAVADKAGNETVKEFVLKYQINAYGIMAVLLCVLTVAGVAVFALHIKKNMKIR